MTSNERDLLQEAKDAIGRLGERFLGPADLRAVLVTEAAADIAAGLQRHLDLLEASKWRCIGPHRQRQNAAGLARATEAAALLLAFGAADGFDVEALRSLWGSRDRDAGALCAWVAALASSCAGGLVCAICPSCGSPATFTPIGYYDEGGSFPLANCSACGSTIGAGRADARPGREVGR